MTSATGSAYNATARFARLADAEAAFALGVARDPQVYVISAGRANAGLAHAVVFKLIDDL